MPVDWAPHRIGDLGKVVTGRTPPSTAERFFGGDVPFLTPSDFDGGRYVTHTARTLSAPGISELKRVLVNKGVAVSCIGWQMGKAVIVERPTATNQQINTIVPDERKVSLLFLYYSLTAKRKEIFNLGASPTRTPIVNKSTFERIEVLVPSHEEQRRITDLLGAVDDKIELNRKMSATLEQIAQTSFKSWFVDFDPVKAKAEGRDPDGMDSETAALLPIEFEDSSPRPHSERVVGPTARTCLRYKPRKKAPQGSSCELLRHGERSPERPSAGGGNKETLRIGREVRGRRHAAGQNNTVP
jgi:type I restriction enzyme S subunit